VKKLILTALAFGLTTVMTTDAFAFPRIFRWRGNTYYQNYQAPMAPAMPMTNPGYRSYSYEPGTVMEPAPVYGGYNYGGYNYGGYNYGGYFSDRLDGASIPDTRRGFRDAADKVNFRY
jgi:hypothetical protein